MNQYYSKCGMKTILTIIVIIFNFLNTYSQNNHKNTKTYNIQRTEKAPKIDGILNEDIWSKLNIAWDFIELEPNNGRPIPERLKTEVKVCYDNEALYFGVYCFDNKPDSILTELTARDEIWRSNSDQFVIMINPFNDNKNFFEFEFSAAGVQMDKKNQDNNWDAIWETEVNINKQGWFAEVKIPFSSLRFSNQENIKWSINFGRHIRRYRTWYTWNYIDNNIDMYVQTGILTGLSNIDPPTRLSIEPYMSIYTDIEDDNINHSFYGGADLKLGLSENFTLDMTLIPDFGQTIFDDEILNLSPFETRYNENRQFFNEGTELFSLGNLFYSRRIGDTPLEYNNITTQYDSIINNPNKNQLINAIKISGRNKNGLGVGVFNALSATTYADVAVMQGIDIEPPEYEIEEILTNPLTNYNIIALDQSINNNSSVSFITTNTIRGNNYRDANVNAVILDLNDKNNMYNISSFLKNSNIIDDSVTSGFSSMIALSKKGGNFRFDLTNYIESDKYDINDLGYLQANNEIGNNLNISYHILKPMGKIINGSSNINIHYGQIYKPNKFTNFSIIGENHITFTNYLSANIKYGINPVEGYDYYETRVLDFESYFLTSKSYNISSWISTDYRKRLALDFSAGGEYEPLYQGYKYHYRISPLFRLNDKFSMRYVMSTSTKKNNVGYIDTDSLNNVLFSKRDIYMITNVLSGSYIINNKMYLKMKLRHYWSQLENIEILNIDNSGLCHTYPIQNIEDYDINFNTWNIDLGFTWHFAPGSEMTFLWQNAINSFNSQLENNYFDNIHSLLNNVQKNTLSLKIKYYLDYNKLKNDNSK